MMASHPPLKRSLNKRKLKSTKNEPPVSLVASKTPRPMGPSRHFVLTVPFGTHRASEASGFVQLGGARSVQRQDLVPRGASEARMQQLLHQHGINIPIENFLLMDTESFMSIRGKGQQQLTDLQKGLIAEIRKKLKKRQVNKMYRLKVKRLSVSRLTPGSVRVDSPEAQNIPENHGSSADRISQNEAEYPPIEDLSDENSIEMVDTPNEICGNQEPPSTRNYYCNKCKIKIQGWDSFIEHIGQHKDDPDLILGSSVDQEVLEEEEEEMEEENEETPDDTFYDKYAYKEQKMKERPFTQYDSSEEDFEDEQPSEYDDEVYENYEDEQQEEFYEQNYSKNDENYDSEEYDGEESDRPEFEEDLHYEEEQLGNDEYYDEQDDVRENFDDYDSEENEESWITEETESMNSGQNLTKSTLNASVSASVSQKRVSSQPPALLIASHLSIPSKPFKCSYCPKKFALDRKRLGHQMRRHQDKLSSQKRLAPLKGHEKKCPVCGMEFLYPASLKKHIVVHTREQNYECPYCFKKMAYKSTVYTHVKKHCKAIKLAQKIGSTPTGRQLVATEAIVKKKSRHSESFEKSRECQHCLKQFAQRKHMLAHIRKQCCPALRLQQKCGSSSNGVPQAANGSNMPTKPPSTPALCHICHGVFAGRRGLSLHLKSHIECTICHHMLNSKRDHLKHLEQKHPDSPEAERLLYACQECGKRFVDKWNCKTHSKQHDQKRQH